MWIFWVLSLLPILVVFGMVLLDKEVSIWEGLISTVVALGMAGLFQYLSVQGMTDDVETWSGHVISAKHFASWREYYEEAVYRTEYYDCGTDSKGRQQTCSRQVFDHWESHRRWHNEYWMVYTTLGEWQINRDKFQYLCRKFKSHYAVAGVRRTGEHNSQMIDGDPNDYESSNTTGWIEPVTDTRHFENRVKASPSLFSYSPVPSNIVVFPWPQSTDLFISDRVMGTARQAINTLPWDQMNAQLGPKKKVNVIIIGYGNQGMNISEYQESAWIGGKKNDLVICYGGEVGKKATWVRVFGWTEKNIVKKNLESLLLMTPVNNNIIPKIQEEINANYEIKDWHKFDYLTIEPPAWSYWVYLGVMIVVQGGLIVWYRFNELNKYTDGTYKFFNSLIGR